MSRAECKVCGICPVVREKSDGHSTELLQSLRFTRKDTERRTDEIDLSYHIDFHTVCSSFCTCGTGGRKDECSAYLTHLSKTKDVALYTLFLQAKRKASQSEKIISISKWWAVWDCLGQADALNHVWPYYLHLVMRAIQAISSINWVESCEIEPSTFFRSSASTLGAYAVVRVDFLNSVLFILFLPIAAKLCAVIWCSYDLWIWTFCTWGSPAWLDTWVQWEKTWKTALTVKVTGFEISMWHHEVASTSQCKRAIFKQEQSLASSWI